MWRSGMMGFVLVGIFVLLRKILDIASRPREGFGLGGHSILFPGPFHRVLRATGQQWKTWQQKKMNELGNGLGRTDLFGMGLFDKPMG